MGTMIKCDNCHVRLDPNGRIQRVASFRYCKPCFKKLYLSCRRCNGLTAKGRSTSPLYCNYCLNIGLDVKRRTPKSVHDIRWSPTTPSQNTTYVNAVSRRSFGVELETASCRFAEDVQGKTVFGAKYDATCRGREFDSPILNGDVGIQEVHNLCDQATRRGWTVDGECGVHLHLDMRSETRQTLRQIGVAYLLTYPVWRTLVDKSRESCGWCRAPSMSVERLKAVRNWGQFADGCDRYEFINFAAYSKHRTFEIRGLQGTLDKTLITNWINAHLAFTYMAVGKSVNTLEDMFRGSTQDRWKVMKKHIGPTARYFGRVRAK